MVDNDLNASQTTFFEFFFHQTNCTKPIVPQSHVEELVDKVASCFQCLRHRRKERPFTLAAVEVSTLMMLEVYYGRSAQRAILEPQHKSM